MGKYYQLYYNEEKCIIQLKPLAKTFLNDKWAKKIDKLSDDDVLYYNSCYYFAKTRKPLKELGLKMKNEWIKKAQEKLALVENIKI